MFNINKTKILNRDSNCARQREQLWKSIFLSNFRSIFGSNSKVTSVCSNILNDFHYNVNCRGIKETIGYHKELERHIRMKMLRQETIFKPSRWTKLNKLGIPCWLNIESALGVDEQYDRAILTALGYYRLYSLSPDDSVINTITDGPSKQFCPELLNDIEAFSTKFFEKRRIPQFVKSSSPAIYATTKAGASGHSAMGEASIVDARSVYDLSIKSKIDKMIDLIYCEGSVKGFQTMFNKSLELFKINFKYRPISARLHLICEGGGKTRPICIPDIWTQTVLKPVHEFLMDCLKRMPNDGTFSHAALAARVKAFTCHHGLYCFDLKAATDRMPRELQQRVLNPLLGKTLSAAILDLMCDRDITYRDKQVRYGCGQPMGMLSSWAIMAITHHVIINYCKKDKSFYAVIGDDMVLHKREAAQKYLEILDSFGMEISLEKSLIPFKGTNTAEIAKRYFRNGVDISPIPPVVLIESTKNLEGFLEFLEVLASRTDNFRNFPALDLSESINLIWKSNKDYGTEKAHVTLTCPIKGYFPFLDNIRKGLAPLTGVTGPWDRSKDRLINNLLDRFILDEAVNELNQNKVVLGMTPGMPKSSLSANRPTGLRITPLVEEYMKHKLNVLQNYVKVYVGIYTDEEDDAFALTPSEVLNKLLSEPDPYSPKDFLEKRKIRRKRGLGLIQKFWTKNKNMISVPIPKPETKPSDS